MPDDVVAGVVVSRPDKLLWPAPRITKRDYVDYLVSVAPQMLPWIRERPLTLVRAPDGVEHHRYFQKDASPSAPAWVRTVTIHAPSARRDVRYVVCNDRRTLAWLGNQAAVELHAATVRMARLDRPDVLVFDLDPPSGGFERAAEVARAVRAVLLDAGLPFGLKTSGGKGVHVVVPLQRRHSPDDVRLASARLAARVVETLPDLATTEFRKSDRDGRVLVDVTRNGGGQTVVAPFSPRARPGAPVSFPIAWEDLGGVSPDDLRIDTARGMLDRPAVRAWAELVRRPARLPSALVRAG
jgi:DNA ligase D